MLVNFSSGHHVVSRSARMLSEPDGTFQKCFNLVFCFLQHEEGLMKILKISHTETALNIKVFLPRIRYIDKQDIDFKKTTAQ